MAPLNPSEEFIPNTLHPHTSICNCVGKLDWMLQSPNQDHYCSASGIANWNRRFCDAPATPPPKSTKIKIIKTCFGQTRPNSTSAPKNANMAMLKIRFVKTARVLNFGECGGASPEETRVARKFRRWVRTTQHLAILNALGTSSKATWKRHLIHRLRQMHGTQNNHTKRNTKHTTPQPKNKMQLHNSTSLCPDPIKRITRAICTVG